MADVKVEMSHEGIEALLSDPAVTADLRKRADAIKARADGMGSASYEIHKRKGYLGGRPYIAIAANSAAAKASNAKHNTLLRSIDAGR